jgi:3-phenylpropionate/trans-cinnamate dioxygenase ferredoxin reductase component
VARWPHRLYDGQLLAVEHWSNAVEQAETAADNMLCAARDRRAHTALPSFWSHQLGVNVKSIGLPAYADSVVVTQGSVEERRFVAAYGRQGRLVAAVAFDQARWLPAYRALIEESAPFPPDLRAADRPIGACVQPAGFGSGPLEPARGVAVRGRVASAALPAIRRDRREVLA